MKTRFSKFINLPELINVWKDCADVQTADMLNLPTPKVEYITVVTKPSEFQKEMIQELGQRADSVRRDNVDSRIDNLLKITSEGRKLALDQRIMNPLLPDDPDSKVNQCVANMFQIWEDTAENKSTQVFFCDLSTPKGRASSKTKTIKNKDESITDGAESNTDLPENEVEEVSSEAFTVYQDIKTKLIAKGVPEQEVKFIHEANTEIQKAQLFAKVRSGEVRFLLGSTDKCGAGANFQDRLVALHHADCPWKPSSIEQREGRIIRQGNMNEQVKVFRYVTEDTFDSYNWAIIERKLKFIGQVFTSKSPSRSAEDIDSNALSAAEIKALATGDPRIKEVMELTVQVDRLKIARSSFMNRRYAMDDDINVNYPIKIQKLKSNIVALTKDVAISKNNAVTTENFKIEVSGQMYTERPKAGQAILQEVQKLDDHTERVPIGKLMGFPMTLYYEHGDYRIQLQGEAKHSVLLSTSDIGNIQRLTNCVEQIEEKLVENQQQLQSVLNNLEVAKEEIDKPFAKEDEFEEKSKRLKELSLELKEEEEKQEGIAKKDAEVELTEDAELEEDIEPFSLQNLAMLKEELKNSEEVVDKDTEIENTITEMKPKSDQVI